MRWLRGGSAPDRDAGGLHTEGCARWAEAQGKVKGPVIPGGRTGDLYIVLRVSEDGSVKRVGGDDLYVDLEVSFPEAALGAEKEVDVFGQKVQVKISGGDAAQREH